MVFWVSREVQYPKILPPGAQYFHHISSYFLPYLIQYLIIFYHIFIMKYWMKILPVVYILYFYPNYFGSPVWFIYIHLQIFEGSHCKKNMPNNSHKIAKSNFETERFMIFLRTPNRSAFCLVTVSLQFLYPLYFLETRSMSQYLRPN